MKVPKSILLNPNLLSLSPCTQHYHQDHIASPNLELHLGSSTVFISGLPGGGSPCHLCNSGYVSTKCWKGESNLLSDKCVSSPSKTAPVSLQWFRWAPHSPPACLVREFWERGQTAWLVPVTSCPLRPCSSRAAVPSARSTSAASFLQWTSASSASPSW